MVLYTEITIGFVGDTIYRINEGSPIFLLVNMQQSGNILSNSFCVNLTTISGTAQCNSVKELVVFTLSALSLKSHSTCRL